MVKPLRPDVDLSGIFAVEFRKQTEDETYESSQQQAARGLEDETAPEDGFQEDADDEPGNDTASGNLFSPAAGPGKISFFA